MAIIIVTYTCFAQKFIVNDKAKPIITMYFHSMSIFSYKSQQDVFIFITTEFLSDSKACLLSVILLHFDLKTVPQKFMTTLIAFRI